MERKYIFAGVFLCFLTGCQSYTTQLREDAKPVQLVFTQDVVRNCQSKGILIGSEGHWYDYLFLANRRMTQAALNDLRNQAFEAGADTLLIPTYTNYFVTSVTIMGQAFQCRKEGSRDTTH